MWLPFPQRGMQPIYPNTCSLFPSRGLLIILSNSSKHDWLSSGHKHTPCKLLQTTWLEECLPKLWYDIGILREIKIKTVFLRYTFLVLSIVHIKICPPKTCVLSYMLMYILMQTTARRYPLAQTLAIQLHPLLCFNTCHRSKGVLKLCAYCLLPAPQWFWSSIDFFLIIQVDTRS